MHPVIFVKRLKRVNRISETELLTHPLKKARAHTTSKQQANHAHRIAARITVGEGRAADHDVRLRRLSLEMHGDWTLHDWRRGSEWGKTAARDVIPAGRVEGLEERVVLDVPRRGNDDLLGMVGASMEGAQIVRAERGYRLTSAEDGVAVRVIPPQLSIVQLEDQIVGRIIDGVDLFQYHFALEGQIGSAQHRLKNQIGEHVGSLR